MCERSRPTQILMPFSHHVLSMQESYQRVGQTMNDSQLEQLRGQMETFRTNLENFARLHRKDIQRDPVFRMNFQKMCANIGVDPLACKREREREIQWGGGRMSWRQFQ